MKPHRDVGDVSHVVNELLVYLTEHPKAQDTVEGIVEWWLLEQRIKRETTRVKEALVGLVAKDFVLERKGRDGRVHYRMNRRKHREIRALLSAQMWSLHHTGG